MQDSPPTTAIFEAYRAERRHYEIQNYVREDLGGIVRYTPMRPDADGIVCFAELAEEDLDREIKTQCAYFGGRGMNFEWKVHAFDRPASLRARLLAHGFIPGVELRRVCEPRELAMIVDVQEAIWQQSFPWLYDQLVSIRNRGSFFCAFDRVTPVGTGWIEYPPGSRFAEIHGGSVLPAYRGRGIYAELLRLRIEDARVRGVPYLTVDAAPMSRPILEKDQFQILCATDPLTWKCPGAASPQGL